MLQNLAQFNKIPVIPKKKYQLKINWGSYLSPRYIFIRSQWGEGNWSVQPCTCTTYVFIILPRIWVVLVLFFHVKQKLKPTTSVSRHRASRSYYVLNQLFRCFFLFCFSRNCYNITIGSILLGILIFDISIFLNTSTSEFDISEKKYL